MEVLIRESNTELAEISLEKAQEILDDLKFLERRRETSIELMDNYKQWYPTLAIKHQQRANRAVVFINELRLRYQSELNKSINYLR